MVQTEIMNTPPANPVIFFHINDTLLNVTQASQIAIESIVRQCPLLARSKRPVEKIVKAYQECINISNLGYETKQFTFEESQNFKINLFWVALKLPSATEGDRQVFNDLYGYIFRENIRPAKEILPTLRSLKKSGFRIAIIMKWPREDCELIAKQIGITKYVEGFFTFEEAGSAKPDANFFKFALEKMGVEAGDAWTLGKSRMHIEGALHAGMKAVICAPRSHLRDTIIDGRNVPVIKGMENLLAILPHKSLTQLTKDMLSEQQLPLGNEPFPGLEQWGAWQEGSFESQVACFFCQALPCVCNLPPQFM